MARVAAQFGFDQQSSDQIGVGARHAGAQKLLAEIQKLVRFNYRHFCCVLKITISERSTRRKSG
jgi:hypothetical protein